MDSSDVLEARRQVLQKQLDAAKTTNERNQLGQFATPAPLAVDILSFARSLLPADCRIRFLDPAFGTGSFYSALLRVFPRSCIASALGYEIDHHYGYPAEQLWAGTGLQLRQADFTCANPPTNDEEKANLVICNPPYVRHHHLESGEKTRLQVQAKRLTGITITKLAGLYTYFLALSDAWLARGGIALWLVPSEFMDVNYGRPMKQYLLHNVALLRLHRFEPTDVQFADALVSSAVVCFKNAPPPPGHVVEFTYGGTLGQPHVMRSIPRRDLEQGRKWTSLPWKEASRSALTEEPTLGDLFTIRRGLATGDNSFFMMDQERLERYNLPHHLLTPILPSPRYVSQDTIDADECGNPVLDRRLFLLTCDLPEDEVREHYPQLWRYLQDGVIAGVSASYLCRHRKPWYVQEKRPPAPFLCTYMGRPAPGKNSPFRFILNLSRATAANTYHLLYPKPALAAALGTDLERLRYVKAALDQIRPETLIGGGRVYGGGLHKVEPNELAAIPAGGILEALNHIGLANDPDSRAAVSVPKQLALL